LANEKEESTVTFEDYMLKEYENIAEAHFTTIEAISSFFRYYLLIMGVPFTIFAVIIGLSPQMGQIVYPLLALTAVISVVISIVGYFVTLYIVNLRMDVVLYARTVNGIRKHFYDEAKLDIGSKLRLRVLPQTPTLPGYFEFYFLPVVISFAIFNSIYLLIGASIFSAPQISQITSFTAISRLPTIIPYWIWLLAISFFAFHIGSYLWIARRRELTYLRSYSIGIDIDGVLNEHRAQFCKFLLQLTGKQLDPEDIVKIPLHEDPKHGVNREDEKTVFDCVKYWTEMPCIESAASSIKKMRNSMKMKIFVFTYRPSPSEKITKDKTQFKEWQEAALQAYKNSNYRFPRLLKKTEHNHKLHNFIEKLVNQIIMFRIGLQDFRFIGMHPIDMITKCWLQKNGIEYDSLTIERGSEDVVDPQGHFKNRFYIGRKKKIRFFIEDDPEKACKLAYICDIVFLIEHPYNKNESVPSNVVRIKSWEELYRQVRKYV